ncbi:MAG: glycosyltransferase [Planctomycetota bacterium]
MADPIQLLAVTRKPTSASYQQRVENWIGPLAAHNIAVTPRTWPKPGAQRKALLDQMAQADAVWWHRNILTSRDAKAVRAVAKRWVIDFDDPLNFSSKNGGQPSWVRRRRFNATVGRADASLVGSSFLGELSKPFNHRIEILPMAVDLPDAIPIREGSEDGSITLLWLGSASTQVYLHDIAEAFTRLPTSPRITLRLVGGEALAFAGIEVDHRPWSEAEQERGLREADLGLCPMPDTLWTRGKCPYKILQYMAWGLPWVGSAVGENIVAAGEGNEARGLTAEGPAAWADAIVRLAENISLRQAMGRRGRAYVERVHDRGALTQQLVRFWREVIAQPPSNPR